MSERFIEFPEVQVAETEYRRLLGYPRGHEPGARALELAAEARAWFAEHGRPWIYLRPAELHLSENALQLDGTEFRSLKLRDYLQRQQADGALYIAVSAGAECEEQARLLWQEAKPDEYFFLEMFGSAIVERLVAITNNLLCAEAAAAGRSALPHYSPGYNGWDVADQNALFDLIVRRSTRPLPGPLAVLSSGMLQPKKSLLGLVGLTSQARPASAAVPCVQCAFAPCQYRRAPYRHAPAPAASASAPPAPRYSVNARALQKWAQERVRFEDHAAAPLVARFRFDGTTCSNMGRPFAFEYTVRLGDRADGYPILATDCRPAPGDEGHRAMCEYLRDPAGLLAAVDTPPPLVGRPLGAVLDWSRSSQSTGCYCEPEARLHKWGLALEAIHFALAQRDARPVHVEPLTTFA